MTAIMDRMLWIPHESLGESERASIVEDLSVEAFQHGEDRKSVV